MAEYDSIEKRRERRERRRRTKFVAGIVLAVLLLALCVQPSL
jgi:hypothetical protein